MRHLTGFAEIADAYRGFIIDLWGVIHDGVTPYGGAIECLTRLHEAGKPFVLLSNAPRRSEPARVAMRAMGIPDALTVNTVTSGELVHDLLRDRRDPFFAALGKRVFHLGPERDRNVIEGFDLARVEHPGDADFVLNTGPDDERNPTDLKAYGPILAACHTAGLPMVCANPDIVVIRGGKRVLCAGALARHYAGLGGIVRLIGKPDATIYGPVIERLAVPLSQVLAIGDALATDIAGAAAAGIDALWVLGGIHGLDAVEAEHEATALRLAPCATLPTFVWRPAV